MENKDLKSLGIAADDRNKFKRKLKDLRLQTEKEKRHCEKERKEKEKLQKKAEKLAEKASRRKWKPNSSDFWYFLHEFLGIPVSIFMKSF